MSRRRSLETVVGRPEQALANGGMTGSRQELHGRHVDGVGRSSEDGTGRRWAGGWERRRRSISLCCSWVPPWHCRSLAAMRRV